MLLPNYFFCLLIFPRFKTKRITQNFVFCHNALILRLPKEKKKRENRLYILRKEIEPYISTHRFSIFDYNSKETAVQFND